MCNFLVNGLKTNKSSIKILPQEHYYFTDYQNAIKMGSWNNNEKSNGGIIRFALFLDYMITDNDAELIVENNYDSIYLSNIKENTGYYWGLKQYEQQTILTIHYIDNSYLGKVWNNDAVYFIK